MSTKYEGKNRRREEDQLQLPIPNVHFNLFFFPSQSQLEPSYKSGLHAW
jgi:hypothetical protein